jgi:nucleoside-diphosphate-sugar epimerase
LQPESLRQLPGAEVVLYAVGFDRASGSSKRSVYVDGLRNVLAEIAQRSRRFLYISSTSVYGHTNGEFVDEASSTEPQEESGRICRHAEAVVWHFFDRAKCGDKRGAIILRLAGIYGPGRLLARIEQLRRGEPVSGNPDAWLNLIHVDDAVRAVLAAEQRGRFGETYLVSDDRPLRRAEYYSALSASHGAPPPRFADLAANAVERQQLNKRCVNRRLRHELAVELEYSTIIEGLAGLPEALQ